MKLLRLKTIILVSPLIFFLLMMALLWRGLFLHPNQIPSPLINKPAPIFQLPTLFDTNKIISNKNLLGHITLLNVWATWCEACAEEHGFLLQIANNPDFVLDGLDYKDAPIAAKNWLKTQGNPYQAVLVDEQGDAAIDWGVYGTPETFVIDKKGTIRYKQIGPITAEIWNDKFKPLIMQLQKEIL